MDVLLGLVALVIPALGGFFWLAGGETLWRGQRGYPLRQVGLGLFVGFGVIQGTVLLSQRVAGELAFLPSLIGIALWCATGALLYRYALRRTPLRALSFPDETSGHRVLWLVLLALTVVHLMLVSVEILYRPVFPWDAWANWMYRAKAWYFAGQVLPMDEPLSWALGTVEHRYAVAGAHYPSFVPALGMWTTTALGRWSETLVNLPYLFAGPALWAGMYGLIRESGQPRWLAALAGYMLLSLPILHTHLSLAGQADVWMAGFVGLGFSVILVGVRDQGSWRWLLGTIMICFGLGVKSEGAIWLLSAALLMVTLSSPRWSLGVAFVGIVSVILIYSMGITVVELPLLGKIGAEDGRLYFSLIGDFAMMRLDLWDDYWNTFFVQGSWHLLWPLLLLAVPLLSGLRGERLVLPVLSFLCILIATQVGIFALTEQGLFAEDWTAINRLPLHFAPALMVCVVMPASLWLRRARQQQAARDLWQVPTASLFLASVLLLAYIAVTSAGQHVEPRRLVASQMKVMVGSVKRSDGGVEMVGFQNGIVLLSSGPVTLQAENYDLMRLTHSGDNTAGVNFFWRRKGDKEGVKSVVVPRGGYGALELLGQPGWQGEISEFGLVFLEDEGKRTRFTEVLLAPYNFYHSAFKLRNDWGALSQWDMRSVHWLPAGSVHALVPLPVWVLTWLVGAALIACLLGRRDPLERRLTSLFVVALCCWLLLDARWLFNATVQARDTVRDFPLAGDGHLMLGDDADNLRLAEAAVRLTRDSSLDRKDSWTLAAEDSGMRFQMLRTKYLMLPTPATTHEQPVNTLLAPPTPSLLVLRERYLEPGVQPRTAKSVQQVLEAAAGEPVTLLREDEWAFFFEIGSTEPEF